MCTLPIYLVFIKCSNFVEFLSCVILIDIARFDCNIIHLKEILYFIEQCVCLYNFSTLENCIFTNNICIYQICIYLHINDVNNLHKTNHATFNVLNANYAYPKRSVVQYLCKYNSMIHFLTIKCSHYYGQLYNATSFFSFLKW